MFRSVKHLLARGHEIPQWRTFLLLFSAFHLFLQEDTNNTSSCDQSGLGTLQPSQLLNTMDSELSRIWLCMYTFTGWIQVTVLIWRQHSAVRIKASVNSMSCKAKPLSVNDAGGRGSNHLPVKIQFFIQSNLHQLTEAKTCGHCYILYLTWWARSLRAEDLSVCTADILYFIWWAWLIRAEDLSAYTVSIFTPHGEQGR